MDISQNHRLWSCKTRLPSSLDFAHQLSAVWPQSSYIPRSSGRICIQLVFSPYSHFSHGRPSVVQSGLRYSSTEFPQVPSSKQASLRIFRGRSSQNHEKQSVGLVRRYSRNPETKHGRKVKCRKTPGVLQSGNYAFRCCWVRYCLHMRPLDSGVETILSIHSPR